MLERTLGIIKPDGVRRNICGAILNRIEQAGLRIVNLKKIHLTYAQAAEFYKVHEHRHFFGEFCTSMSSSPIIAFVLEGENAVQRYRDLLGATNPAEAAPGTLRKEYGLSIGENTLHGSDSVENALIEIAFFFPKSDLLF